MKSPTLTYAAPEASLSGFISFFYEFRSYADHFDDVDRADYAQLRFILGGTNGWFEFVDGMRQPMPQIYVVGPTTGNTRVSGDGQIHLFGVGLLPAGWGAIMPMDAANAVNRVFNAAEIFGPIMSRAAEELLSADEGAPRVAIGNRLIEQLIGFDDRHARKFTGLVDNWLASDLSPDVDELVRSSGLSRRQVERKCNQYYGVPPKLLARKYRATRAAVKLAKGEVTPEDLLEHGFYDQSHFIRELRYFTGLTPTTIKDNLPMLSQLTIRRTENAGISPLAASTIAPSAS